MCGNPRGQDTLYWPGFLLSAEDADLLMLSLIQGTSVSKCSLNGHIRIISVSSSRVMVKTEV